MSIFVAMLAFSDEGLLKAAKLGVLLGSLVAATLGLGWGIAYVDPQLPAKLDLSGSGYLPTPARVGVGIPDLSELTTPSIVCYRSRRYAYGARIAAGRTRHSASP